MDISGFQTKYISLEYFNNEMLDSNAKKNELQFTFKIFYQANT